MASVPVLESLLDRFRQIASALPAPRTGANQRYSLADAASCALATFFLQSPSFLDFQRRMQKKDARSHCQSLFGVGKIPCDNHLRNLLDGHDPDHFAPLFADCLQTAHDHAALDPFLRLDGRVAIALDGIPLQCSNAIHCDQCSTRHVGPHKTEQSFHSMLAATVVADGHNRALPLLPHCVQPQHNPHDNRTHEERKQDCERNAAKRWLPAHSDQLRPFRPVFLGDDLYCCQPLCQLVRHLEADFLFICKPSSHKRLYELMHDDFTHSSGWIRTRNHKRQVEQHRYRWVHGLPVRDSDDALLGTWIEFQIQRHGERTYSNTFCTSLEVTAENVAAIARLGRARWKVENEGFNCLARHGYNSKRNFGHGRHGLANLLATLNLFACALHTLLDCLRGLWRQCRDEAGPRRTCFEDLRSLTKRFWFPHWTSLRTTMLGEGESRAGPSPAPS